MKLFLIVIIWVMFACTPINQVEKTANSISGLNIAQFNHETDFDDLLRFNYALATEFLKESDKAMLLRDSANATLIISAASIAHGNALGKSGTAVTNRLLAGLGLMEGIRYGKPNGSVSAFLTAAETHTCLASLSLAYKGDTTEKSAILWEMMVKAQSDLRRQLVRRNLNVLTLVTNLAGDNNSDIQDELVQLRNEKRATQQRKEIASLLGDDKNARSDFRYILLGCFLV